MINNTIGSAFKYFEQNELLNQQINSNENLINEDPLNEISDKSKEEIKTDEDESEKLPLNKASDESKKEIKKYTPKLPENLALDLKERCEKIAEEYSNTKTIQFSLNNDERQEQILAIMILMAEGNMQLFSNYDLDLLKNYANFTQNIEKYNFLYPSDVINKIGKLPPRGEWIEENIQTSNTELIILFFLKEFESLDSKDRPKFDECDYKNYKNIYFKLNTHKADTLIIFVDQNNNSIEHGDGLYKKEMTLSCNLDAISKYFPVVKNWAQYAPIKNGMQQIRVTIDEKAQEQHVVHLVNYLENLNLYDLSNNKEIVELIEIFWLFNYFGMDNENFTSELFSSVSESLGDFFPQLFPLACQTNNQFLLENLVSSMFHYAAISKENFEVVEKLLKESKWSMKKLNLKNPELSSNLMLINDDTLRLLENVCFQDIEHFLIEVNYEITDKGINCILELENLRSLHLSCPEITGKNWKDLQSLTNLTSLKLTDNCTKLTDEALENIGKCHSLTELIVDNSGTDGLNYEITDKGINCILELEKLRFLHLSCPEITGKNWKDLQSLTELISLKLTDCTKLNNEALKNIGKCRSLKELILDNSGTELIVGGDLQAQFDNKALKYLSSLIYLEHLNLNYNSLLDRETLSYLVENLKNLRSLELKNCMNVIEGCEDLNSVRENVLDGFKHEKLSSVLLSCWVKTRYKIPRDVYIPGTKKFVKESGKWELKNQ